MRSCEQLLIALASTVVVSRAPAQLVRPGDVLVVSEVLGPNNSSNSTLRVFDGCTGVFKAGFTDPAWVASGSGRHVEVSPDGTIWVSDPTAEKLYRYDADLNLLCGTAATTGNHIGGFAFESASVLHAVAGPGSSGPLLHVDALSCAVLPNGPALGFAPVDAAWHPSGLLCVTVNVGANGLRMVEPSSSATVRAIDCGGTLGNALMSIDTTSSGLIVVTENLQRRLVGIDPAQPPGAECVWSIPTTADAYPWLAGIDVDESRGRIYTMVRRSGTYWLEAFDSSSRTRISSWDIGGGSVHNLAVVPNGSCSPRSYCTAGISTNLCQAVITASGTPSLSATSGFTLTASLVESQRMGLIFYGISGRNASPWGGTSTSYLCVKAPTQRTPVVNSGGPSMSCSGSIALDWLAYLATHPNALGQPFSVGDEVNAQCWYRDPPAAKTTNLSNAIEWTVVP
ncbi:MAG: hypothetical protein IT454_02365 [Planctomycetes bacterium]|nr:hypothetical protein [Planctomycetota bacterium]